MKFITKTVLFYFIIGLFSSLILQSCNTSTTENSQQTNSDSNQITAQDSTELTKLVRQTYTWVNTTEQKPDFEPTQTNPTDTIYSGLDLEKQKARLEQLEKSGFFAKEFLESYTQVATKMNEKIKSGSDIWLVGDMSPFANDVDMWCNCQDILEKYWKKITLSKFEKQGEETAFVCTLEEGFTYKIRAKKENESWKISYLEGFDIQN